MENITVIADCGATKCDWVALDENNNEVLRTSTLGMSPHYVNAEQISQLVHESGDLQSIAKGTKALYFYGAGCSSPIDQKTVADGLSPLFSNADLNIDHDLMGAAHATFQGEPCFACILGTGANATFFNGNSTHKAIPSLGFILGDEGSGAFIGKLLTKAHFYGDMPEHLSKAFESEFDITLDKLMQHLYNKPYPNRYMASLSRFAGKYRQEPFIQSVLNEAFTAFFSVQIFCYDYAEKHPINFVGSIANVFEEELRIVAKQMGLTVGKIVGKPLDGMINYHIEQRQ